MLLAGAVDGARATYDLTVIARANRRACAWISAPARTQPSASAPKNRACDHRGHRALTSPPSQNPSA